MARIEPRRKAEPYRLPTPGLYDLFIAEPGNYIVGGDLVQIQALIIAILAQDEPMLDDFSEQRDFHTRNALALFRLTPEQWENLPKDRMKNLRRAAKEFAFGGLMFGGSPHTIAEQVRKTKPDITEQQCQSAMDAWGEKHPAILRWQVEQVRKAYRDGFVEVPLLGVRHYFYGTVDPNIAKNFPVQGLEAYIMKGIVKRVDRRLSWPEEGILAQIHDACYTSGPDPLRLWRILKEEMERPLELDGRAYKIRADVGIGQNLAEVDRWKFPTEKEAEKWLAERTPETVGRPHGA